MVIICYGVWAIIQANLNLICCACMWLNREILLDVLPVISKPVVPKIIKNLALKGIIYPKRAAYMISLYAMTAPSTPVTLTSLYTVCRSNELVNMDSQLMKTCWLGVGTLIHKLNIHHLKTAVPKSYSHSAIQEAIQVYTNLTYRPTHCSIFVLKIIQINYSNLLY